FIGLNAAGTAGLGNGGAGVAIIQSPSNYIGGDTSVVYQYVSANQSDGIYIFEANGSFIRPNNFVGVGSDIVTPLGNGTFGIRLNGATNTSVIPLWVAHNGAAGVAVTGSLAAGNKIFFWENFGNGGLPIDLGNNGATPNDSDGTDNDT